MQAEVAVSVHEGEAGGICSHKADRWYLPTEYDRLCYLT